MVKSTIRGRATTRSLVLDASTARDLMTSSPITVSEDQVIGEAVAVLVDQGVSAVPVVDASGRPVGVLSRADVVRRDREEAGFCPTGADYFDVAKLELPGGESARGFQLERIDGTPVSAIMTPDVFSVGPEVPADIVVQKMLDLGVHRLFVLDAGGALIGVVSALDVLRALRVG